MLDTLKQSGNPYYQFYDDYQAYQEKCKTEDPIGHDIIFKLDNDGSDELMETLDQAQYYNLNDNLNQSENNSDDDEDQEERDEIEYITKDAVKKWHFDYNKSLCLSSKFPESSASSDSNIPIITVAP